MKNTDTNNMSNNPIEELREMTSPVSEQEWASITSDKRYMQKFGRKHGLSPRGRAAIITGAVALLVTVPILVKTFTNHDKETTQVLVPETESIQSPAGSVESTTVVNATEAPSSTVTAKKTEQEATTPNTVSVTNQAAEHERLVMSDVIANRQQTVESQSPESWPPILRTDPTSSTNAQRALQNAQTTPAKIEKVEMKPVQNIRAEESPSSAIKVVPNDIETSVTAGGEETVKYDPAGEPEQEADQFFIPSAFTPNGDGLNDLFYVKANFEPKNYELSVFNRNGDLVFITRDLNTGWDGKQHGATMTQGMYVYLIKYKDREGNEKRKQGQILLVP